MQSYRLLFIALIFIFGITVLKAQDYEARFQERAAFITQRTYDYGWVSADQEYRPPGFKGYNPADFGKYVYPWMIAHYEMDGLDALNNPECAKIRQYFNEGYHNKPTFHFNLVGLPRLMYRFPEIKNFWKNSNGGHLKDYLDRVFNRQDSYNAFTGEGTENHVNMSRTSGYLYAQLAIDSGYTPSVSGWDPAAMLDSMKSWVLAQSKRLYKTGAAEWNSSTYGVYNIIGWLNLYDYAHDEEVQKAARAVLDYYAAELALHYTQGITGGAEMRGGGSTESCAAETDILSYLWFGDSPAAPAETNFSAKNCRQSVHAATSNYRPPLAAVRLARKRVTQTPASYRNSKGGYLYQEPSMIKETFYVSDHYTLGAAYTPYGGWGGGDWQVVSWKLAARVDSGQSANAQYAAGGLAWDGYNKTQLFGQPFEQVVHHENVLVQMTRRPADFQPGKSAVSNLYADWQAQWEEDFDQRFPGYSKPNPVHFQDAQASQNQTVFTFSDQAGISTLMENNILFVEMNKVYLAIRSINSTSPSSPEISGDFRWIRDAGPAGELTGLALEVGEKQNFSDFADFRSQISTSSSLDISNLENGHLFYKALSGDVLDIRYQSSGSFTEPIYDWGYGLQEQRALHTSPPLQVPDFSSVDQGANANWSVNSIAMSLNAGWAVYEGPHLQLKDQILTLNDSLGNIYEVNYQGSLPAFSTATGMHPRNKNGDRAAGIRVYPNPAKDYVIVHSKTHPLQHARLTLTDVQGRLVKQQACSHPGENRLSVQGLKPGVYFLKVQSKGLQLQRKLMVE